ncbi:MAG: methylthioribulose 1-phosphate dehydratase [Vicinamibacteria bacterium]
MPTAETLAALSDLARLCYSRGWVFGTSGNFSAVLEREPLRLAITPSGADKGALEAGAMIEIDRDGQRLSGQGRPSAETAIHLTIARAAGAGAVAHTHSTWSTLLSETHAAVGGLAIQGYEMLKGLAGVETHAHREWIPILENTQDWVAAAPAVEERLRGAAGAHAFLIRGHGLYTWGCDVGEARRHVEILEFLLEVVGRSTWRS